MLDFVVEIEHPPEPPHSNAMVRKAVDAAAAAEHVAVAVLHKDGHFDRLAKVLSFESVSLPID